MPDRDPHPYLLRFRARETEMTLTPVLARLRASTASSKLVPWLGRRQRRSPGRRSPLVRRQRQRVRAPPESLFAARLHSEATTGIEPV